MNAKENPDEMGVSIPEGYMLVKESEYEDCLQLVHRFESSVKNMKDGKSSMSTEMAHHVAKVIRNSNNNRQNPNGRNQSDLVKAFENKCRESTLRSRIETQKSDVKIRLRKEQPKLQKKQKECQNELNKRFEQGRDAVRKAYQDELMNSFQNKNALNNSLPVEQYACEELLSDYRECVEKQLLPAMDSMYQDHCHKIDGALRTWVENYTNRVLKQSQLSPAVQNKIDSINERLRQLQKGEFSSAAVQQKLDPVVERVTTEIRRFEVQTVRPEPTLEEQIDTAIAQEDYHLALEKALNAKDLALVMQTCERISVDEMFGESPSQLILLSTIAHLRVNLHEELEVKASYLLEALEALNGDDRTTLSHAVPLLQDLLRHIDAAKEVISPQDYKRHLKSLRWAAEMFVR